MIWLRRIHESELDITPTSWGSLTALIHKTPIVAAAKGERVDVIKRDGLVAIRWGDSRGQRGAPQMGWAVYCDAVNVLAAAEEKLTGKNWDNMVAAIQAAGRLAAASPLADVVSSLREPEQRNEK